MASPQDYSLSIYRGDSYRWRFVLWQDAARTQPVDLTGVLVAATIRDKSGMIPLTCTVTGNQIDVVLDAATSGALTAGSPGNWDLQLTYPAGDVKTIVAGGVTIRLDVTGAPATATAAAGVSA